MGQEIEREDGQLPLPFDDGSPVTTAMEKWLVELGKSAMSMGEMMKKPTENRPFVYEVRFDLLSLSQSVATVVLKGFGREGGLVAFHDCVGFVDGIRGVDGRLKSGKVNWYEDSYPPSKYADKLALLRNGSVYRQS